MCESIDEEYCKHLQAFVYCLAGYKSKFSMNLLIQGPGKFCTGFCSKVRIVYTINITLHHTNNFV